MKMKRFCFALGISFLFFVSVIPVHGVPTVVMEHRTYPLLNQDVVLSIATRHDSIIYNKFAEEFAKTQLAHDVGITSADQINFIVPSTYSAFSRLMSDSRFGVSLGWGGGPTVFNELVQDNAVSSINDLDVTTLIKSVVNDSISGGQMIRYNSTGGILWVANALSSFGFTVNNKVLQERGLSKPKTWEDLASLDFYTDLGTYNVGLGNAPDSTSNTRIYQIILQKYGWERGWEIIYGMAGNGRIYGGSVETRSSVITGETAAAMTIDFYGLIAMQENQDCEYIIPENASIISGDPIALAKTPVNEPAAYAFLKFLFSQEGQALWLDPSINRVPIRADAFDTALGQTRPDIRDLYYTTIRTHGIEFNETLSFSLEETMRYHFEATITDVHDSLRMAWDKIATSYFNGNLDHNRLTEIMAIFGAPAISMDEAIHVNEQIIQDQTFRASKQNEWRSFASDKYTNQVSSWFGSSMVPSEPQDFHAVLSNQTSSVYLEWSPPTGFEASILYYVIYRGTSHDGPYQAIANTTAQSYIDSSVLPGKTYFYVVTAVNAIGESAFSLEAQVTIPSNEETLPSNSLVSPSEMNIFSFMPLFAVLLNLSLIIIIYRVKRQNPFS